VVAEVTLFLLLPARFREASAGAIEAWARFAGIEIRVGEVGAG
jgi:hypothetical protein